jgi:hypothetical protein
VVTAGLHAWAPSPSNEVSGVGLTGVLITSNAIDATVTASIAAPTVPAAKSAKLFSRMEI